ncbi:MAG: rubrerythrin family protein [Candidatus Saccharibacteria bacterium]|nr:rubrerythrin family protein [Candidatus Saccharibacteria bacterium]MBR1795975.1 rubrerythrin family protein [Candidatus Saccharibacteria bacterium]MDO4987062.1 rubrerythrin family protein [Candidatus Saccharibacteria bacterium]
MSKNLEGSKTLENLKVAFAGESQARVKYQFYASRAKKDGYEQVSEIFTETSDNEKEHAKIWYKLINDGVGDTKENLKLAIEGETYEYSDMYREFAETARREGFDEIAEKFEQVGNIEKEHEARFSKLLQNIEDDIVFKSDKVTVWKCRNCGYIYTGDKAPEVCPVCAHPQSFFEIKATNY